MRSSRGSRRAAALEVLTADTLRPSVHQFFDRITAEQWTLITQGSPDDATKMLLADLILEMISSVTAAISTAVEEDPSSKESLVSGLDQSLRRSLTEVLHIPDHVDDVSIRCVTDMIKEEVKEGLEAAFSGSPQKITTLCSLNSMILIVTNVMKKFSKRVKKVFRPRKAERRKEPPAEAREAEPELPEPACGSSLSRELKDIVSPILDIVPDRDYEEVFSETATEIQALSEDIGSLLDGTGGRKNPLKLCKRKIINFFARCFLKVWIHRLVSQLRRQHQELRTGEGGAAAKAIVAAVTSWLESDQQNSLVLGFHTATSEESLFTRTVSELIYQGLLADSPSRDAQRNQELYADIKKKAWKFESSMNWFLKSLVVKFAAKVNILSPIMEDAEGPEEGDSSRLAAVEAPASEASDAEEEPGQPDQPAGEQEPPTAAAAEEEEVKPPAPSVPLLQTAEEPEESQKDLESLRAFVLFLIEKVLNHIHYEAKVVPQYNDQVLQALLAHIWPRVWDQTAHLRLSENSFKKMNRTIHQDLCEKLGDPNEVLFMLQHSEEPIIEDYTIHIARKLLRPSRKYNICRGCCAFLG